MDEDLRELERRFARTHDSRDEAALLVARARAGLVRSDELELAALLGHDAARIALGRELFPEAPRVSEKAGRILEGLADKMAKRLVGRPGLRGVRARSLLGGSVVELDPELEDDDGVGWCTPDDTEARRVDDEMRGWLARDLDVPWDDRGAWSRAPWEREVMRALGLWERSASWFGTHLVVFAKDPQPGRAKTRLAAHVGAEKAARLAAAFLDDTLVHAARGAAIEGATLVVAHAPGDEATRLRFVDRLGRLGIGGARFLAQPDVPSLGERMAAAFERFAGRVTAIGTDSPDVEPARYADHVGTALGPADDGGYWLVSAPSGRDAAPAFRDPRIRWSTEHALEDTLAALARVGLAADLVDEHEDVDDLAGLERLRERLKARPEAAPRTARLLAEA